MKKSKERRVKRADELWELIGLLLVKPGMFRRFTQKGNQLKPWKGLILRWAVLPRWLMNK